MADLTVKDITTATTKKQTNKKKHLRTKKEKENSMSPTDTDESLSDETIPSKKQTSYSLTLYHSTNTILIQGNRKSIWVTKEFPQLDSNPQPLSS